MKITLGWGREAPLMLRKGKYKFPLDLFSISSIMNRKERKVTQTNAPYCIL